MNVLIADDAVCVEVGGYLKGPWRLEIEPPRVENDWNWILRCSALTIAVHEKEHARAIKRFRFELGLLSTFPASDWCER